MALGDIVTNLTVNQRPFEQGLSNAEQRFRRFGTTVQSTSRSMFSGRGTQALLELSRGAEDAAISFGTSGLQGAIRGSANNLAAFATLINPMAGVVVGLGAALGSVLIPRLLETKSAADLAKEAVEGLDKKLADIRAEQEGTQNLADLRGGKEGSLEDQRKKVEGLRKEQEALVTSLQSLAKEQSFLENIRDPVFGFDDDRLAAIKREITENEKRLRETRRTLQTEEFALHEGETVSGPRRREFIGQRSTVAQDQEYRLRLVREQSERDRAERLERQRMRDIDEDSMRRSVLASFTGRRDALLRQREGLSQSRRSFNLPELATRGNSVDKIIEMAQAKKEAIAESQRKMQLEKLDKLIELNEKLINAVKDAGPSLKPARVG